MQDSWTPEPEPSGSLDPPRRRPPTAVGVATPPPPRPRQPSYVDRRMTRRKRLASAFVGSLMTASAASLATVGSLWPAVLSTGLGAVGGVLLYRAFRSSRAPGPSALSLLHFARRLRARRSRAA